MQHRVPRSGNEWHPHCLALTLQTQARTQHPHCPPWDTQRPEPATWARMTQAEALSCKASGGAGDRVLPRYVLGSAFLGAGGVHGLRVLCARGMHVRLHHAAGGHGCPGVSEE